MPVQCHHIEVPRWPREPCCKTMHHCSTWCLRRFLAIPLQHQMREQQIPLPPPRHHPQRENAQEVLLALAARSVTAPGHHLSHGHVLPLERGGRVAPPPRRHRLQCHRSHLSPHKACPLWYPAQPQRYHWIPCAPLPRCRSCLARGRCRQGLRRRCCQRCSLCSCCLQHWRA